MVVGEISAIFDL